MADDDKDKYAKLTGADLKITVDRNLLNNGSGAIEVGDAETQLAQRLRDVIGGEWPDFGERVNEDSYGAPGGQSWLERDLAEVIVDAIGEKHLNKELVAKIDLRPFLAQMAAKGNVVVTTRTEGAWSALLQGHDDGLVGGSGTRKVDQRVLQFISDKLNKAGAEQLVSQADKNLTPEQLAQVQADAEKVNPNVASLAPDAVVAKAVADGKRTTTADGSLASVDEMMTQNEGLMPAQEAVDLFMLDGSQDITRLIEAEGSMQTEPTMFSEGELLSISDPPTSPAAFARDIRLPDKEAALLISSGRFTPTQIGRLQEKLKRAGYFDGLDEPVMGDASDIATSTAWFRALGDRTRSRKPLPVLLAERSKARMDQRILADDRVALNQLAFQTLGRRLEPLEMAKFEAHLREFQGGQRPATEMNPDGTSSSTSFSNDTWFTPGQAQQALLTDHEPELQRTQSAASTAAAVDGMSTWFKDLGVG